MIKVVAIASAALLLGIAGVALYPSTCSKDSTDICHYEVLHPLPEPLYEVPSILFEAYVKGFPHNGMWMPKTDDSHTFGCEITPSLEAFDTCLPYGKYLLAALDANPSLKKEVYRQEAFDGKGYVLVINDQRLRMGMNPQVRKNYENGLKIAEKKILAPDFADSDIEATLKELSQVLLEGLNQEKGAPMTGGIYRDHVVIVQPDDKATNETALFQFIEQRNGPQAIQTFTDILLRIQERGIESVIETFSKEEQKIWNSVFYTAPFPKEVPSLMKTFVEQYRDILKRDVHPIARAAWVHMQFVNIHPFAGAMGREGRILMNAELKRGGYAPIVFFDDAEYTQAVKEDNERPGAFAQYLARIYHVSLPLNEMTQFPELV